MTIQQIIQQRIEDLCDDGWDIDDAEAEAEAEFNRWEHDQYDSAKDDGEV